MSSLVQMKIPPKKSSDLFSDLDDIFADLKKSPTTTPPATPALTSSAPAKDSPPVHLKMSAVDKQLIDTLCDEKPGQNLDHLVKMKKMKMIDLFEEIGNIFDEQLRSNFEGNRRTSLSNFRIDRTGLPRLGKIPKNPMDEEEEFLDLLHSPKSIRGDPLVSLKQGSMKKRKSIIEEIDELVQDENKTKKFIDILECNKSHNDLLASTEIFLAVPFKAREKKKDDFLDWLVETTKNTTQRELKADAKSLAAGVIVYFRSQTMIQHINDPDGLKCLRSFLKAELAVENLDFLVAVLKFEELPKEKMQENLKLLYSCWIDTNSPYCINISQKLRAQFEADFAAQKFVGIFTGMKADLVFVLQDHYTRYPFTDYFMDYVEMKIANPPTLFTPLMLADAIRKARETKDPFVENWEKKRQGLAKSS